MQEVLNFNFENLNIFDLFIYAIISISMIIAFFRGFVISFLNFFSWLLALFMVIKFYPEISGFLVSYIKSKIFLNLASTIGVFILILMLCSIINSKIIAIIRSLVGGVIDRVVGAGFGFVRGCIIASAIFWSINSLLITLNNDEEVDWIKKSHSYNLMKNSSDILVDVISNETTKDELKNILQTAKSIVKKGAEGDIRDQNNNEIVANDNIKTVTKPFPKMTIEEFKE